MATYAEIAAINNIAEGLLLKIERLTRENHAQFFEDLERLLRRSMVWDTLFEPDTNGDPPTRPADTEKSEQKAWDNLSTAACEWIWDAAGPEHKTLLSPFRKTKDASGMRKALLDKFQAPTAHTRFRKLGDMFLFQRKLDEDYASVFKRADEEMVEYQKLCPKDFNLKAQQDEMRLFMVLSTIDQSHPFRMSPSTKKNLSYETLQDEVNFYEGNNNNAATSLRKAPIVSAYSSAVAEELASAAAITSSNRCLFCDFVGHRLQTCRFFIHYRTEWRKNRTTDRPFPSIAPPPAKSFQPALAFDPKKHMIRGKGFNQQPHVTARHKRLDYQHITIRGDD